MDRFVLISPIRPPAVKSSSGVSVESYCRGEEWALSFSLNSPRFESAFKSLCEDLYNSTWDTDPGKAAFVFVDIYNRWRQAFSSKSKPLSEKEIQGLVGEMLVVRDILSKTMSPDNILKSWTLASFGRQDFVTQDKWVEVKSILDFSPSVKISSVEQLDDDNAGVLIVVKLRKTSTEDSKKVTVNSLIDELYKMFSESGCGEEFLSIVDEFDLPAPGYDEYCYRLCEYICYDVGSEFPCIRRKNIPDAVNKIEYELDLHAIEQFRRYDGKA